MKYIIRVYLINTQIRTFLSGKQMIMICCYNLGVLFSSSKYQMKLECLPNIGRHKIIITFVQNGGKGFTSLQNDSKEKILLSLFFTIVHMKPFLNMFSAWLI